MVVIVPDLTLREPGVGPGQNYWPASQPRARVNPGPPGPPVTQLWMQIGAGQPIVTTDPLAGVQSGVANSASGQVSTCLGGSSNVASGGGSTCLGGFSNTADGSSAGVIASFLCESSGTTSMCIASNGAVASGLGSSCVSSAGGVASGKWSACIGGTNGVAAGDNSVSIAGGNAPNNGDVAVGVASSNVGFFGVACVPQQSAGGSGIAGPAYTLNEQQMLQAVYSAMVKLGLIA